MDTIKRKATNNSSQEQLDSLVETAHREKPPIFTGFTLFKEDEDGFFIQNTSDGSIFKWIDVDSLEPNGKFFNEVKFSKGGRRNFQGTVFSCFRKTDGKGYYETDDKTFKSCVKKFGGFYVAISRARKDSRGNVSFAAKNQMVNMITLSSAKSKAEEYSEKYAQNNEFISKLPCGAAFDCIFESIYEHFRAEVMAVKEEDELAYDAWNRYEKIVRSKFHRKGVYGLFDLFQGSDITTEVYDSFFCRVYRCGLAHGLYLISDCEQEKLDLTASFPLGDRNFTAADAKWVDHGYRIVLLPQKI